MPSAWIEQRAGRKGRVWVVRWQVQRGGVVHRGSKACGPFKLMAEKVRARKLEELTAGDLGLPVRTGDGSWAALAEAYLDHSRHHKAPRTFRNFDARAVDKFGQFLGRRPLSAVTSQFVAGWESALREEFRPTTARIYLRGIRTALRWGEAHGFITKAPTVTMPRVDPVGRALTDAEVTALVTAVPAGRRGPILFALHTGVRRGEALGLVWERIRRHPDGPWEAEIGGIGGPATKTGVSRMIPLPGAARAALGAPRGAGRIWRETEEISHVVERAGIKAGLGRVRFHDLRHTWATKFMSATGDIFALMRIGGWRSLSSVSVYQHVTKARAEAALSVDYALNLPPIETALSTVKPCPE